MKTKVLLMALAIFGSSFVFATQPVSHESSTDCEKKVLNKIKRKMSHLGVKEYLAAGERQAVIITCYVNDDKTVEVARIDGNNQELNEAIINTLEKHPVKCDKAPSGEYFTFKMILTHRPA